MLRHRERSSFGPRLKNPQRSTIGPLSEVLPTLSLAWNSSQLDPTRLSALLGTASATTTALAHELGDLPASQRVAQSPQVSRCRGSDVSGCSYLRSTGAHAARAFSAALIMDTPSASAICARPLALHGSLATLPTGTEGLRCL
jgi:hypothetical protein